MTPFEVYCIMQADTICSALVGIVVIGVIGGVFLTGLGIAVKCDPYASEKGEKVAELVRRIGISVFLGTTLIIYPVVMFMPSTKTLCAMYAVPAIVNNETLQQDLGDVYELGMERLKEVLDTDDE